MDNPVSTATTELVIVSAEGHLYSGAVRMVEVPARAGVLGILPRHAPLLADLKPGEVRLVNADGEEEFIYVSGGYLEVQPTAVTILADTAMRGEDVDEVQAREAIKRAEKVIRTARLFVDRDRAQLEVMKALAQLKVLEDSRRKKKRGM